MVTTLPGRSHIQNSGALFFFVFLPSFLPSFRGPTGQPWAPPRNKAAKQAPCGFPLPVQGFLVQIKKTLESSIAQQELELETPLAMGEGAMKPLLCSWLNQWLTSPQRLREVQMSWKMVLEPKDQIEHQLPDDDESDSEVSVDLDNAVPLANYTQLLF